MALWGEEVASDFGKRDESRQQLTESHAMQVLRMTHSKLAVLRFAHLSHTCSQENVHMRAHTHLTQD